VIAHRQLRLYAVVYRIVALDTNGRIAMVLEGVTAELAGGEIPLYLTYALSAAVVSK
jgi:hypothetical protein